MPGSDPEWTVATDPRQHPDNWITVPDAARMLGLPRYRIWNWIRLGHVDRRPDGKIDGHGLLTYLDTRGQAGLARDSRTPGTQPDHDPPDTPSA